MDQPATAEFATPELVLNPDSLKSNLMSINYVRSLMAIASGVAAGIAGLTGSRGFLLYLGVHLATNLLLFGRMHGKVNEYLLPDMTAAWFAVDGVLGQALSFVMFWTLSFAMIHIF